MLAERDTLPSEYGLDRPYTGPTKVLPSKVDFSVLRRYLNVLPYNVVLPKVHVLPEVLPEILSTFVRSESTRTCTCTVRGRVRVG